MANHITTHSHDSEQNTTNKSLKLIDLTKKSLQILRPAEVDFEKISIRTAIIFRLTETNDTNFVKISIGNEEEIEEKIDFQNTSKTSLIKNEDAVQLDMREYTLEALLKSESPKIKEVIEKKWIKIILWITLFRLLGSEGKYSVLSYENWENIWVEKTDLDKKIILLMKEEDYLSWSSDDEL